MWRKSQHQKMLWKIFREMMDFQKTFLKKQERLLDVQCALFNKIRTVYEQSMDLENTLSISELHFIDSVELIVLDNETKVHR